MYKIQERWKDVRIEKPYLIRFRVKPYDDRVAKDRNIIVIANLSAGGIFFYYNTNLEVDTLLDLKIDFSRSYPNIKCVGNVIRVKRYLSTCISGHAIEFTKLQQQLRT